MVENRVRCKDAATYWRNIVANHGSLVEIVFLVVYYIYFTSKGTSISGKFPSVTFGSSGPEQAEASIREITRPEDDSD